MEKAYTGLMVQNFDSEHCRITVSLTNSIPVMQFGIDFCRYSAQKKKKMEKRRRRRNQKETKLRNC